MGKLSNLKHKYFVWNRIEWRKEKKRCFVLTPPPPLQVFKPGEGSHVQTACNSSAMLEVIVLLHHSRQLLKMLRRDTVVGGVAMMSKNVLPHPLLLLRILCAL